MNYRTISAASSAALFVLISASSATSMAHPRRLPIPQLKPRVDRTVVMPKKVMGMPHARNPFETICADGADCTPMPCDPVDGEGCNGPAR